MREIKFRFWDRHGKRWATTQDIDPTMLADREDGPLHIFKLWAKDFDACQYTGLKDKNGREIYEGDVVRVCGDPYVLEFSDGQLVIIESLHPFCDLCSDYDGIDSEENVEVIGNIYENPELKGEKS